MTVPASMEGCRVIIFIVWSGNNPVKYTDPDRLNDEESDFLQKVTDYFVSTINGYIDSLKEEATVSGRGTLSVNFAATFNGIKVKGSLAGVAEYNNEGNLTLSVVAGLDIGVGTPGQELSGTGADATLGLRASFGKFVNEVDGNPSYGLCSISLAANASTQIFGFGVKFEARKDILKFDTPSGGMQFNLFDQNKTKVGISSNRQIGTIPGIGTINIGGGFRVNGL
jgi:hypothetical protein